MELFNPWVGILVQVGSGMLGIILAVSWMERKERSFRENVSTLKTPLAIMLCCYTLGAINLFIRFA